MKLEIKGLRSMPGREGEAYSFQLHIDGKAAATVLNEGNGGSTLIRFHGGHNCAESKRFYDYVKAQAPIQLAPDDDAYGLFPDGKMSMTPDLFLAILVDNHVAAKVAATKARREDAK